MSDPRQKKNRIVVCTNGKDYAASLLRPREKFFDWLRESSGYFPWLERLGGVFIVYMFGGIATLLILIIFDAMFKSSIILELAQIAYLINVVNGILWGLSIVFLSAEYGLWYFLVREKSSRP